MDYMPKTTLISDQLAKVISTCLARKILTRSRLRPDNPLIIGFVKDIYINK